MSYQPLPTTPSGQGTLPVSVDTTPPYTSPRRRSSSHSTPRPPSLLASAIPRGFRIRPIPIALAIFILLLLSGPLIHPASRSVVTDYLRFSNTITTDLSLTHIPPPSGAIPAHLKVPLTLEARLSFLLSRPALHQWEAEFASRHKCPFYTFNRNVYFFHDGKPEIWEKIGPAEIRRYRSKIVDYLRGVEREGGKLVWDKELEANTPSSERKGLIFTAGDKPSLTRLEFNLRMLRKVIKSKILIHVYHFKGELEEPALKAEKERLSEEYDLQFIQVGGRRQDGKSWNIKNIAFIHTQFTEFVYMDSDNIPLIDPLELFESVEYKQAGSVFWSDLNKDHPDNAIFRIMGRDCSDQHWPGEAGQIVFNKAANNGLNLAVLHLSHHMMSEDEMYGILSYGDKDTFRFSFYALGLDYQMAPRIFASAGGYQTENGDDSKEFCGHSMLHWGLTPVSKRNDPTYHPKPAFIHTVLAKHRYHLQPEKLFTHIYKPRLDGILEPTLVRTYYEWTGACFGITLKGPDGAPGAPNSMLDGQGVDMISMEELLRNNALWGELKAISQEFVNIPH